MSDPKQSLHPHYNSLPDSELDDGRISFRRKPKEREQPTEPSGDDRGAAPKKDETEKPDQPKRSGS